LDNWIGYYKIKKGKDSVRLLIAGGFSGRTTSHTQVATSLEMLREETEATGLIPSSLNFVFDLRNVFNRLVDIKSLAQFTLTFYDIFICDDVKYVTKWLRL
jgi:hypothetical protein